MKTLLFTNEFPPFKGGIANYYGQLVNYWPIDQELLILDNNKSELIKSGGFFAWQPAIGALKRKIKKINRRISMIRFVCIEKRILFKVKV